MMAVRFIAPTT